SDAPVLGYEIHMGMSEPTRACPAAFEIVARNARATSARDGAIGGGGTIVGTMLHGVFENDALRAHTLAALRERRGVPAPAARSIPTKRAEYDRLEAAVRGSLGGDLLWQLAGLPPRRSC